MAYVKTVWETGDVITAEKLNNMEDGIDKATLQIVPLKEGTPPTFDMTWQEVKDLFDAGYLMCVFSLPFFISSVYIEENVYYVEVFQPHLSNGHLEDLNIYACNSADDYPIFTQQE